MGELLHISRVWFSNNASLLKRRPQFSLLKAVTGKISYFDRGKRQSDRSDRELIFIFTGLHLTHPFLSGLVFFFNYYYSIQVMKSIALNISSSKLILS